MPEVEQLLQKNGVTIKIGDYLELGDLVGNKYTLTWHYDMHLEQPYEMHKHDTFDFKYVELMPNELSRFKEIELHYQNLPVHKLLSGLSDQVKSILLEPGQATTVRTCFFEIAIEQALEAGEVKIIQGYQENGAAEKSLLEDLGFMHESFTIGILTYEELMRAFEDCYLHYYQYGQTKWPIRYRSTYKGDMFGNGIEDL